MVMKNARAPHGSGRDPVKPATETSSRYLLSLDDPACTESARAGAKAATLASLVAAGFPVPQGFVLTTEAFRASGVREVAGGATNRRPELSEGVERALLQVAAGFGDAPLAVRSSSLAEDLTDASFAGQYGTVLGVRGPQELVEAVRRCWASASSASAIAYRARTGSGGPAPMAVLVQRLIEPDASGVAFTADPVSGDRSTTIVEAVRGLGDRAVAGEITPERWRGVFDEPPYREGSVEGVLDPGTVLEVTRLARRVEAHREGPQDIEWAVADGRVWLLQARPITGLPDVLEPVPVSVEVPEGFWEREASHAPLPHSPYLRSVKFPLANHAWRAMCEEFGALLETIDLREIGGWEYIRLVPLGGKDRTPPPAWMMGVLARLVPAMRRRARAAMEAVEHDRSGAHIRQWHQRVRAELEAEIARLRDVDRAALSDEELDQHMGQLMAFGQRAVDIHFFLHGAIALPMYELALAGRELLGLDDAGVCQLLSGLSIVSTRPARGLAELAHRVAERPELRALLDRPDSETLARIEEADPQFAQAFATYRHEYGCRALRYEVAEPTLGESPELLLRLIRDQVAASFDPEGLAGAMELRRARALEEANRILASRSSEDRERFDQVLRRAQEAYPVREDNEWYTVSAPIALARFAAQEVGRRLARRGQIEEPEDVFLLEEPEARAALRDGTERRSLVGRRRGERAWVEAHPGPSSYGRRPGPPPSFKNLPDAVRVINEAILWYAERIFEAERGGHAQDVATGRLSGIGASPGRFTGPARLIMDEVEFDRLEAGDVVVCPITSPVWSVVFPSVGALVTDTGGILSHPAIIAREYKVPAVVATGNATSVLRDGQRITVDGTAGVVEVA
jgi:phosphohistidine swiveling domain-containing protein